MSWSIQYVGKPDKIIEKLNAESSRLTGQSKQEFDDAKPALEILLSQNVGGNGVVRIAASGHANFTDGKKTHGVCSVAIDPVYGELAV